MKTKGAYVYANQLPEYNILFNDSANYNVMYTYCGLSAIVRYLSHISI